jgi:transcriptional regulator with XRE-family HTH domain
MADLEAYYRLKLKEEYELRLQKKSSYSQNSFAKFLGMTSSYYSKLMKGKIILSLDLADKITKKLQLSQENRKSFILSVSEEHHCHALYLIDPTYTDCNPKLDTSNSLPKRVKNSR